LYGKLPFGYLIPKGELVGIPKQQPFRKQPTLLKAIPRAHPGVIKSKNLKKLFLVYFDSKYNIGTAEMKPPYIAKPLGDKEKGFIEKSL